MKIKDAIRYLIDSTRGIYSRHESESIAYIISDFIGFPRREVLLQDEQELSPAQESFIRNAAKDLGKSRPVQYILGETEFFGLKFRLNENVLIPRQETEELVERIIRENIIPDPSILDLGSGSGCISVSLAKYIPKASILATDISGMALKITRENAELNKVNVKTKKDDMMNTGLDKKARFDIIVSNPPYVCESEKEKMHDNVLKYEPSLALFVKDDDPLVFYRVIAGIAFNMLNSEGKLYVEINERFSKDVVSVFTSGGLIRPEIIPDIHDKNRFVKVIKP